MFKLQCRLCYIHFGDSSNSKLFQQCQQLLTLGWFLTFWLKFTSDPSGAKPSYCLGLCLRCGKVGLLRGKSRGCCSNTCNIPVHTCVLFSLSSLGTASCQPPLSCHVPGLPERHHCLPEGPGSTEGQPSQVAICGESTGVRLWSWLLRSWWADLPQLRAQILIFSAVKIFHFQLLSFQQHKNIPLHTGSPATPAFLQTEDAIVR